MEWHKTTTKKKKISGNKLDRLQKEAFGKIDAIAKTDESEKDETDSERQSVYAKTIPLNGSKRSSAFSEESQNDDYRCCVFSDR